MESTIVKVRQHIDAIIAYLGPLLPLVNCHMVEFFTQNHWEKLLPSALRHQLEQWELNDTVNKFWKTAGGYRDTETCNLTDWVNKAQSHYILVDEDYCISTQKLQQMIRSWGGDIKSQIKVKDFMTSKKSYEVQTMSHLIASFYDSVKSNCCVEVGGGRGHLLVALSLEYGVRSLTVECDETTLSGAIKRVKIIQKQWHSIAKRLENCDKKVHKSVTDNKRLHQFTNAFVTQHTNITELVSDKYPEIDNADNVRILLTGLHTCGNLGPDSLRIFVRQPAVAAVFNVPCCYHLLTESLDVDMFDVFQKNYGDGDVVQGFPMSEHLKGFNVGRNARMLAAQSMQRVASLRQMPSRSLLHRAVLQEIIKKYLPNTLLSEGKLKRVASKCKNFEEYFKTADGVLKLDLYDRMREQCLQEFCGDFELKWKKIVLFYLLRLCLAQVVESVILLDRLLFLLENGFDKVYLVKLFDPVLSPRCHGIVAVR